MIRRRLGVIAAAVTLAVLGGSGAAIASWHATAAAPATASSTTVASTFARAGGLDTTYRYTGTSSPVVTGTLALANTGTTPLSYTLANATTGSTVLAQKVALTLWTGTCGATIPATGTVATTLADPAPTLPAAARTLAPGAKVTVCVATRIAGSDTSTTNAALQGQAVTAALSATGTVGTAWTTTAAATPLTQSVYRMAAIGTVGCSSSGFFSSRVTLRWQAPADRPVGGRVDYRIVDTATGGVVTTVASDASSVSVELAARSLPTEGTFALAVEATEAATGTTTPLSGTVSVTRDLRIFDLFRWVSCS